MKTLCVALVVVALVGFGMIADAAGCRGVAGCHRPTPTATLAPTPTPTLAPSPTPTPTPSPAPTPALTPAPSPSLDGSYDAGAIDAVEADFLVLVNNYRAQNGLGPLTLDTRLNAAADWKSNELGLLYNYFDHDEPACPSIDPKCGESWTQVFCDFGYCYNTWLAQNLAAGYDTAQQVFDGFRGSPEHNATMIDPHYLVIGIGRVTVPGSPYNTYWTVDFGGVRTQ